MTDVQPSGDHERPKRDVLTLLSLIFAAPMCLWSALLLGFIEIAATVSRIPIVIYWLCGALSLTAVVLAAVSKITAERPEGPRRARMRKLGLTLGLLGISAMLVLPPRVIFTAHEQAVGLACRANLKQIGQALLAYSAGHAGQFPPRLQTLVDTGTPPDLFVCPSTSKKAVGFDPRDVDATGDYCYGRASSDSVRPTVPIVWDRWSNHPGGGEMCYVDGHVVWVQAADMRKQVEDALPYYSAPPELPPPAAPPSGK